MTKTQRVSISLFAVCVFAISGCVTGVANRMPAVLESADPGTMAAIKAALSEALDRAEVELGPGDLTATSTIAVLPSRPSPYEDRSPAMPILFDIEMRSGSCFIVRRDTNEAYLLAGVACRASGG